MWQPLTEFSEVDYRFVADLADGGTESLAETLRIVATRPYANQLSAVTSLGRLSLTTAKTWHDDQSSRHPQITISLRPDRLMAISYHPVSEARKTASLWVKTPEEAASYIDVLMNRMLHDLDRTLNPTSKVGNEGGGDGAGAAD